LGNTDGSGNISGTVPGSVFKVGQQFSIGNEIFTVNVTGTPAIMLTTGSATTHTYNTSTGAYVINGAAADTTAYFYPAEPIMGISVFNETGKSLSDLPTIVFDTQFAYTYTGSAWTSPGSTVWHGDNNNFFWGTTWRSTAQETAAFFASNFYVKNLNGAIDANDDPIYYSTDGTTWYDFSPYMVVTYDAGGPTTTKIKTARIILPFKNRLILLNTVETDGTNNTNYNNRCRFSINGSPFAGSASNYYGWLEPNQTYGTGAGS
jgi:hypothetical protein